MTSNCSVWDQPGGPSNEGAIVRESVYRPLQRSLDGHRAFTRMHAGNVNEAMSSLVRHFEMQKRGVRFLPAQVVNRAVRQINRKGRADRRAINPAI
ncbi:hypothetical protein QF010_000815 [Pseudomonas silensiensis]